MLEIGVEGVSLIMLVDSGATTNVVDENTWEDLKRDSIKCVSRKATSQLKAYPSDKPLEVKGIFHCEVRAGNSKTNADFTVIKGRG